MVDRKIDIIGAAMGWGAQLYETQLGPQKLKDLGFFPDFWRAIVSPSSLHSDGKRLEYAQRLSEIANFNQKLSSQVSASFREHLFPVVIGGDHTSAIGTWSAMAEAHEGEFGLIWIDAHMDSHTPQTTHSHAIHGMPVAALLGCGEESLLSVSKSAPALKPENLALIGVRSFEEGEALFLKEMKVKIFDMDEVKRRGFKSVFEDAIAHVTQRTKAYGISIDLDAFDPTVAPGVGSPAPKGLMADDVCAALSEKNNDPRLKAFEIAEFNPTRDKDNQTAKLIEKLVASLGASNPRIE